MKHLLITLLLAAVGAVHGGAALAQSAPGGTDHSAHHTATVEMSDGEVRRVDRDQKKITLRHGEMKNLGMPPMTMVFQVAEPAWVDQFKVGDKVKFVAEQRNGAYTVVKIERAQ